MSATLPYQSGYAVSTPPERQDAWIGRALFWLALLAGVASVVVGVLMLVWPDATLGVAAVLFGLWLLVHGVLRIAEAVMATWANPGARALAGIVGVLFVVAGVLCLRDLLVSLAVVVTLIGVTWLVAGLIELAGAVTAPGTAAERAMGAVLPGALSILGGIAVLVWPRISLLTIVYVTGIWLIVMGLVQVYLVVRARRTVRELVT
ncbi:HdeD family acid-resistance protein [Micromonospora sp. CPCC 206061]|uniref:HdeD family acid-resistance protein n=1 Tax=Micromonospora sp. CPCC 206061 TaxID=3122410 RepID=UPI002FF22A71